MRYLSVCILLFLSVGLMGQAVTNGSLNGAPIGNSRIAAGSAAGWTACGFSPDLCDVTHPSYVTTSQVTPVASPDGGNWLGVAALGECAQTTITGLSIGQTYTLYFCGACFGTGTTIYNQGPAAPRVCVGATCQNFSIPMVASTWNPYQMTFTATAATMTLSVTHPNGSVAYASLDGFNLTTPCGNPQVVQTQNDTICEGDSVALVGTNGQGAYQWYPSGNTSNIISNDDTCWVSPTTTTRYVVSNNGATDTAEVYVIPISAAAGLDQTICLGDSVQLGGTPTGPAGSTFQWAPATGLSNAVAANPYAMPQTTTTYTVTVTNMQCQEVDTVVVTVVTGIPYASTVSVCQGQAAIIHGQAQSTAGVYTDTLQGSNGCDSISNVTLVVNPIQNTAFSYTICENDSVQVNGTYYSSATHFSVTYASALGCDSIVTYTIEQIVKPVVNLGPDIEECDGNQVAIGLGPMPVGFTTMWWNGSNNPTQIVTESGEYWVTVTHPQCYVITDTVVVNFKDCNFYIYVPNAFTPNGDPNNAHFRAKYYGELEELEMLIFNRWGELLFTSENPTDAWDGTFNGQPVKEDVYVWKINYKSKYEERKSIIGKVTLLR